MVCYYSRYQSDRTLFFWISPLVNLRDVSELAMLFSLRKAGGLQILCCQEIAVANYGFTLDALALKPSGFCNVRVNVKIKSSGNLPIFRLTAWLRTLVSTPYISARSRSNMARSPRTRIIFLTMASLTMIAFVFSGISIS